jgi:hypothetical protein
MLHLNRDGKDLLCAALMLVPFVLAVLKSLF